MSEKPSKPPIQIDLSAKAEAKLEIRFVDAVTAATAAEASGA
jgi:hypothetical protein